MRTTRITATVLVSLMATSGALAAQGARQSPSRLALAMPGIELREPYDPALARAELVRANQLGVEGRFAEAWRAYAAVARMQKEAGVPADEALWQVASFSLFLGNTQRAVAALDEVADDAELHGNPVVQARALIEAAILHHRLGNNRAAKARLQRLEPLLNSPFLSEQDRASIEGRIHRE